MKIEIKNHWSNEVIFSHEQEDNTMAITVAKARESGANLRSANLYGADLSGANLRSANLCDANLCGANLTPIRDDIWAVLSSVPGEVAGLIEAIKAGNVDGSTYEGNCSCLVGTVAAVRGVGYRNIPSLAPDASRPAERFFIGIRKGDTPETNPVSALALAWSEEWLLRMRQAFDPMYQRPSLGPVPELALPADPEGGEL